MALRPEQIIQENIGPRAAALEKAIDEQLRNQRFALDSKRLRLTLFTSEMNPDVWEAVKRRYLASGWRLFNYKYHADIDYSDPRETTYHSVEMEA